MVHRVVYRLKSEDAVTFWSERLAEEGIQTEMDGSRLCFRDPEGLELELARVETDDEPLVAEHPDIPADLALQGFEGVRAYSPAPDASRQFLDAAMGFVAVEPPDLWESRGDERRSFYAYDRPPRERGRSGAGTVHHVAWPAPLPPP
jgi:glyoxalase family protein